MKTKAQKIVETLQAHGHDAVFAGGFVRDSLLGRESNDIDIATSATPEQVEALFEKTVAVGKAFGVVVVVIDGVEFEVATFRNDIGTDGRRPEKVEFTTMDGDAKRRDFTINGLFLDPVTGKVHDHVNGMADLKAGVVRFIGDPDARIAEDKLRILRFVRFGLVLGFELETESAKAVKRHAHEVLEVSAERITAELVKMLKAGKPRQMMTLLDRFGFLAMLLPEVKALQGVKQDPTWHPEGDAFEHTLKVMENLTGETVELQLAGMLHDTGKARASQVTRGRITSRGHAEESAELANDVLFRLKLSRKATEHVVSLVSDHMKPLSFKSMKRATRRKFVSLPHFADLLTLHKADKLGGAGDLSSVEMMTAFVEQFKNEPVKPDPLVTGRDLIELGFGTGRVLGDLKREIFDLQLEGTLTDKAQALEFAKSRL